MKYDIKTTLIVPDDSVLPEVTEEIKMALADVGTVESISVVEQPIVPVPDPKFEEIPVNAGTNAIERGLDAGQAAYYKFTSLNAPQMGFALSLREQKPICEVLIAEGTGENIEQYWQNALDWYAKKPMNRFGRDRNVNYPPRTWCRMQGQNSGTILQIREIATPATTFYVYVKNTSTTKATYYLSVISAI